MAKVRVGENLQTEPRDDRGNTIDWRMMWLLHGGFSRRNAEKIAEDFSIDYRYAIQVLDNAQRKGFSEKFVMDLIT